MGMAHSLNNIQVISLFSSEAMAASGTATSAAIDMDCMRIEGDMSIKLTVTGDGTVKVQYLLSDATAYITPSIAPDITANFTKTSGTGGVDIYSFHTETAAKMKIKVTETGGVDTVSVSLVLMVQ